MPIASKKVHLRSIAAYSAEKRASEAQARAMSTSKPHLQTRRQAHESTLQEAIQSLTMQVEELRTSLRLAETKNDHLVNEKNTLLAEHKLGIWEHVQQRKLLQAMLLETQKSLIETREELNTIQIRVRRVEREKTAKNDLYRQQIQQTRQAEDKATKIFTDLSHFTASAKQRVSEVEVKSVKDLTSERQTSTKLRLRIKQLDSQRRRAEQSLLETRCRLNSLRTWKSTEHGIFAEVKGGCGDGTTDRKTTYEAHHTTLKCPSYLPNVDDTDLSTWSHQTRFIKVEPAIDHTAKTQLEGTKHLAKEIADAYSNSPLAKRDGMSMEVDDWVRKEEFQNMDHAADGKKKLALCVEWKREVLTHDVGDEVLDFAETGEISPHLSVLTSEVLDDLKTQATSSILPDLAALGRNALEAMPLSVRESLLAIRFAGCCAHKDMNAFKYGVVAMTEMWEKENLTPPVLLANKANASTIRLGDVHSQAVQAAVEASTRGGVKATSLAGSLFNHSDDKKGYQDTHRNFMAIRKKENVTHMQLLLTYHPEYVELIEMVTDGKINPGFNHMESNLHHALHDIPTLTELAAMALYGVSLSWPYLRITRGPGGNTAGRRAMDNGVVE